MSENHFRSREYNYIVVSDSERSFKTFKYMV